MSPEAKADGKAVGYADRTHERTEGRDACKRNLLKHTGNGSVERDRPWTVTLNGGIAEPR